jgi:hypothetical protein
LYQQSAILVAIYHEYKHNQMRGMKKEKNAAAYRTTAYIA